MAQLTFKVVRHPGGWAVEFDDRILCCYRSQEQAIAQARLIGRDRWEDDGSHARVEVESVTGGRRIEVTFGAALLAG